MSGNLTEHTVCQRRCAIKIVMVETSWLSEDMPKYLPCRRNSEDMSRHVCQKKRWNSCQNWCPRDFQHHKMMKMIFVTFNNYNVHIVRRYINMYIYIQLYFQQYINTYYYFLHTHAHIYIYICGRPREKMRRMRCCFVNRFFVVVGITRSNVIFSVLKLEDTNWRMALVHLGDPGHPVLKDLYLDHHVSNFFNPLFRTILRTWENVLSANLEHPEDIYIYIHT